MGLGSPQFLSVNCGKNMIFALLIRPDYIYNLVYLIDSETDLELELLLRSKSNGLIGLIVALIIVGTTKLFC
jgi:hypothetical protein